MNTTTESKTTPRKRGKTAGNSSEVLNAKRAAKRAEAEERNAAWAAKSPALQFALVALTPGNSARQIARIKALL